MAEHTAISWTDHTFNPWWGCFKVSPGCKNCYAEYLAVHRRHMPIWGPASTTSRKKMSDDHWKQPLKWNQKAEQAGKRARVFCASMADVFEDHPDVVEERERLWTLIEQTPNLDWLLLTKRPENIEKMVPERWEPYLGKGMPINVWIGTSVENQEMFDLRWPLLESAARACGIEILFLSIEPQIGPINIQEALIEHEMGDEEWRTFTRTVDWVIQGGESGSGYRPFDAQWARDVRDQCAPFEEVAYFFKQHGGTKKIHGVAGGDELDGVVYHQWPNDPKIKPVQPEVQVLVAVQESFTQLSLF